MDEILISLDDVVLSNIGLVSDVFLNNVKGLKEINLITILSESFFRYSVKQSKYEWIAFKYYRNGELYMGIVSYIEHSKMEKLEDVYKFHHRENVLNFLLGE